MRVLRRYHALGSRVCYPGRFNLPIFLPPALSIVVRFSVRLLPLPSSGSGTCRRFGGGIAPSPGCYSGGLFGCGDVQGGRPREGSRSTVEVVEGKHSVEVLGFLDEPTVIVGGHIGSYVDGHQIFGKVAVGRSLDGETCLVVRVVLPIKCQGCLKDVARRQVGRRSRCRRIRGTATLFETA